MRSARRSSRTDARRVVEHRGSRVRRRRDLRVARVRERPRRRARRAGRAHGVDGPRLRLRPGWSRGGAGPGRFGPLMIAAGFGIFLSSLSWANGSGALHDRDRVRPRAGGALPARVPRVPDRPARSRFERGARRRRVRDGVRLQLVGDAARRLRARQPARGRLRPRCRARWLLARPARRARVVVARRHRRARSRRRRAGPPLRRSLALLDRFVRARSRDDRVPVPVRRVRPGRRAIPRSRRSGASRSS